eukprot:2488372-Alexandrium_andersonii.AAC.1
MIDENTSPAQTCVGLRCVMTTYGIKHLYLARPVCAHAEHHPLPDAEQHAPLPTCCPRTESQAPKRPQARVARMT